MRISDWSSDVCSSDLGTARAVEADGVHFVEISEGAVTLGQAAEFGNRRYIAIHRVDGLERDDLGAFRGDRAQLTFEVGRVAVLEDALFSTAVADALDHRGVVQRVGEHDAVRQPGG